MKKCCRTKPQRNSGDWQKERANILQRLCMSIEKQASQGRKVRPLIHRAARRWNGKPFRCDPKRTLTLSAGRLTALFYKWRRETKTAGVFALHYTPRRERVAKSFLLKFVNYCSVPRSRSLRAVWNEMAAHSGKQPISYTTALRYFSSAQHRAIQGELLKMAHAKTVAQGLIAQAKAKIGDHYQPKGGRV